MSDGTPIDRDKIRSVGYLAGGRTRPVVVEGRLADGTRTKSTTDELGNTVTEHDSTDDRVDVTIRPDTVRASLVLREVD
jgi:hypothetical protein